MPLKVFYWYTRLKRGWNVLIATSGVQGWYKPDKLEDYE